MPAAVYQTLNNHFLENIVPLGFKKKLRVGVSSPSREGVHDVEGALLRHAVHLLGPFPHHSAHALLEQPLQLLLARSLR